jgi:hypothetical protein
LVPNQSGPRSAPRLGGGCAGASASPPPAFPCLYVLSPSQHDDEACTVFLYGAAISLARSTLTPTVATSATKPAASRGGSGSSRHATKPPTAAGAGSVVAPPPSHSQTHPMLERRRHQVDLDVQLERRRDSIHHMSMRWWPWRTPAGGGAVSPPLPMRFLHEGGAFEHRWPDL